jgi:hypothetical protein
MNAIRCSCLFLFGLATTVPAQNPPHLALQLDVTIASGGIAARACLSRLPARSRHQFILHRGLNVKSVRDSSGDPLRYTGHVGGRFIGEGIVYTVVDSVAPGGLLCVEYVGAFPVYAVDRGDYSTDNDHKGAIAFNGRTVRAAEQSKWYPIPYDSARGTGSYVMTYRATVRCADCRAIYLNGDGPKPGPSADFASERPVPMLVFAGDFETESLPGLTFINATPHAISRRAVEILAGVVDSVRGYHEQLLGTPYGPDVVFLQHTITEDNPGRHWGFVTFPTIAFSNRGFSVFVDDTAGAFAPMLWPYLGHEMAHYYFGTLVRGSGPYFWFLIESLAEYVGLLTVRRFQGDAAFLARIRPYAQHARSDTTSVPFDRITSAEQMHDRYRYEYGPLLMVALEEAAGDGAVRGLLQSILREPHRDWDYATIRAAVLEAGVPLATWQQFESRCIRPSFATGCIAEYATREQIGDRGR